MIKSCRRSRSMILPTLLSANPLAEEFDELGRAVVADPTASVLGVMHARRLVVIWQ
jgi:predicted transcriptional regulator with HTH domain